MINREVHEFHSVVFEPRLGTSSCKVAIHTTSKKKLEVGQKQFSNDPNIQCVDMYQLKNDKNLGFVIKPIGHPPSEKITDLYFS